MNDRNHTHTPSDAFEQIKLAFIEAYGRGALVSDWLQRYPDHCRALIDLATALDLEAQRGAPNPDDVARAGQALRAAFQKVAGFPLVAPAPGLVARVRAREIKLSTLATELRLLPAILVKLDQGFIVVGSVPQRLLKQLGAAFDVSPEQVLTWLPRTPQTAASQYYSDRAPERARQETFAEALAHARALSEADRRFWEEVLCEEGLGND
jgi:hypothetical protein